MVAKLVAAFEVSLRNSIHATASAVHGTEFWFDRPKVLLPKQRATIQDARDELTKYAKPQTAGRIIAALSFGFWTTLLNRPYEAHLWHANRLALLRAAFPNLPRYARTRRAVHQRCNAVRLLRSRVMNDTYREGRGRIEHRLRGSIAALP